MIKKISILNLSFLMLAAVSLLTSCGSSKDVTYFKNREALEQAAKGYLFDARIMPKDVLTITVSTVRDELQRHG